MKNRARKKKDAPPPTDDADERGPYGYVLILRALASFAIRFPERPGALRVLCVVSDYVNQDGECRVSQATIADRLGLTRNAVNQHLKFLDKTGTLFAEAPYGDGKLKTYLFDCDHVRNGRQGQDAVERGRAKRRAARREASEKVGPKEPKQPRERKTKRDLPCDAHGRPFDPQQPHHPQECRETGPERPPVAPNADAEAKERPPAVGDRLRHRTGGGVGTVVEVSEDWVVVIDDKHKRHHHCSVADFEHILLGDPGFEPPEPLQCQPGDFVWHYGHGNGRVEDVGAETVRVSFGSGEEHEVNPAFLIEQMPA